jgi:hypothetical protein
MPKTAKGSKSKPGPSKGGINKSAFIRSIPLTTPANDVVKLAAEKGIKINAGLVYAVRSSDKNKGGAPKRKPGRPPKSASAQPAMPNTVKLSVPSKGDLRHQFVSIAVRIGTDEAQRLLDSLVDVQTQIGKAVAK